MAKSRYSLTDITKITVGGPHVGKIAPYPMPPWRPMRGQSGPKWGPNNFVHGTPCQLGGPLVHIAESGYKTRIALGVSHVGNVAIYIILAAPHGDKMNVGTQPVPFFWEGGGAKQALNQSPYLTPTDLQRQKWKN